MMDPRRLPTALRRLPRDRAGRERIERVQDYVASMTPDQLSAVRGLGTRLAIISESHTSRYLSPVDNGTIDLRAALNGGQVVMFSLNSSIYGKLAAQIGTLAIQDLVAATGHRLSDPGAQAIIGIDEFSGLGGDNVISLLARGRESGISVMLATQELADLDRAARGFRDQVLGVTAIKIVHRQEVPASAQMIAEMIGTRMVWRPTYQIARGPLGAYSNSRGSRRQVEEYVVHPNLIKSLRTGEAVVTTKIPNASVRTVRVRAAANRDGHER
jgi:conjugal transfer pilus assembly protein TraD